MIFGWPMLVSVTGRKSTMCPREWPLVKALAGIAMKAVFPLQHFPAVCLQITLLRYLIIRMTVTAVLQSSEGSYIAARSFLHYMAITSVVIILPAMSG